jgi:Ser-tRNA(Ala) deacylase AlaX
MMRKHTASHLLDHCLTATTGSRVETTDSWLGPSPYVGYRQDAPSDLDLKRVQDLANGLIQQGLNVEIETMDRVDAERMIDNAPNLARLPNNVKLRIVTIEGQLQIPCDGTHVLNLKEIGALEIRGTDPTETGFRPLFEVK